MRIWILSSNRWFSAISAYGIELSRGLAARGHSVQLTLWPGSKAIAHAATSHHLLSTDVYCGLLPFLRRFLRSSSGDTWDAIITLGGPEMALSQLARLFSSVVGQRPAPRLIRLKGDDFRGWTFRGRVLRALSFLGIERVVFPCQQLADQAPRGLPRPAIIAYGTERSSRPDDSKKSKTINILLVGRLDPVKGHHFMIRVFRQLKAVAPADWPLITLTFFGNAANLSVKELWDYARELKVHSRLRIISDNSDPLEAMGNATLGVIPSLGSEKICRVACEFLLSGCPILVSNVGGLPEMLFEGAGAMFPASDEAGCTERLLEWIPVWWAEGHEARNRRRQHALTRFSRDTMARSFEALLS